MITFAGCVRVTKVGDYKLVAGYPGLFPDWYLPVHVGKPNITGWENCLDNMGNIDWENLLKTAAGQVRSEAPHNYFLFNLKDDPTEHNNIYDDHPDVVKMLKARMDAHMRDYVPANFPLPDPKSNPDKWGGAWSPGWC